MPKIANATPPAVLPEHWVQILQQTIFNLGQAGFPVAVSNSRQSSERLNISVDGIRVCGTCHDFILARATNAAGDCPRCAGAGRASNGTGDDSA